MNYLEFHGTSIYDKTQRDILDKAIFDTYSIVKHEYLNDGTFVTSPFDTSCTFISNGILYYFLTGQSSQISSFFELNVCKENCISGQNQVYYEIM